MKEAILATTGLTKKFGGLVANRNVSISLYKGSVHAILGPNGAGKSTLINLLSGDLLPSEGSVRFKGQEVSSFSADHRARLGIGRSYQKTNIFRDFSVYENCRLAAQARYPEPLRVFKDAQASPLIRDAAMKALAMTGMESAAKVRAAQLSHGAQRQLEIAMVLASGAEVLLLDEPLAGMGNDEAKSMVDLIRKLASDHAILLVEHDMDFVFAVADVITVMVEGQVLESGSPESVKSSPAVQNAYLGEDCDAIV